MRGILPDGFYFHREVGVKLSAESENERGGDKGREQKRGQGQGLPAQWVERGGALRGHRVVLAAVCVGVSVGVWAESQLEPGLELTRRLG